MRSKDIPIPYRIVALIQERNRLFAYPLEQMAGDIWSARFRCTCLRGVLYTGSQQPHFPAGP